MHTVPDRREALKQELRRIFPDAAGSGLTVRELDEGGSPQVTAIWIDGLADPDMVRGLVLVPLQDPLPAVSPQELARSGRFAAPHLQPAADLWELQEGLMKGLAAIHREGSAGVLLVGDSTLPTAPRPIGPNLAENLAALRRHLRYPEVRAETFRGANGSHGAVLHLHGVASPAVVRSVGAWARRQGLAQPSQPLWRRLSAAVMLPDALGITCPATVASLVRKGYVAVLYDGRPEALVAPVTLGLLINGLQDAVLPPAVSKVVTWPRWVAVVFGFSLGPGFVAVTSYHHSLLPGPFLVTLASTRQNMPFPIGLEVVLAVLLTDVLWAGGLRLGGGRLALAGVTGTLLALLTALYAGILSAASVAIGITSAVVTLLVPNYATDLLTRIWRYPLITGAAMLGLYGVGLVAFAMMIGLAEASSFGHPVREQPAGNGS